MSAPFDLTTLLDSPSSRHLAVDGEGRLIAADWPWIEVMAERWKDAVRSGDARPFIAVLCAVAVAVRDSERAAARGGE